MTRLSDREEQIANGLVSGNRVKDIAAQLGISPHTVRNHLKSIYRKKGVKTQLELVAKMGGPATMDAGDLVIKAATFAEKAHQGQVRKYTGEPYIVHPAEVARIVSTVPGATANMIAAAWLHDVVEDTDVTDEDLRREFPAYVANMVWWLTDVSRPEDGNRAARKAIDRRHIAGAGPMVHTIKLADLISNTSTIARFDPDFAEVYLAEKRALLEVLTQGNATLHAVATALAKQQEVKHG